MEMEDQEHGPPAYGTLIKIAREAEGISPETAAARMPHKFSGSSWRQIEAGWRGTGDNRKRVPGRASTVAAMARTVGITSDRLSEHHPEAAVILREMELKEARRAPQMPEVLRTAPAHVRRMIDAALEDVDPEDVPGLLREMAADYEAVMKRRIQETASPQRPRHAG
jgi:hypothetical protein